MNRRQRANRRRGTSDEELVNGVLLPGFTGTAVPGWLARAADTGLAGACLFAANVGPGLRTLTAALHDRRAGFLVASDEEGGPVTRLDATGGPAWPCAAALGHLDEEATTAAVAAGIGAQCRDLGIDLALAPVADVNAEPRNPVIGIRSFGATPELVARHTAAFVRGLQDAGTAAAAKHFPGHGSTTVDSHRALPVVRDDVATLRARDLPPFAAAVAAGVRCVLTAHVLFPALDERPATMSPPLLGLLRRELGFDGVVISDALDMQAIAATVGMGPGAVAAVAAGVDLVCIGNPQNGYDDETGYRQVRDALLAALADGTLPRERVAEAGRRVADLANRARAAPPQRSGGGPAGLRAGAVLRGRSAGSGERATAHRRSKTAPRAPASPPERSGGDPAPLGEHVVRRVAAVAGDVRIGPGAHVLDLTGAVNVADGRAGEPRLAAALRRRDPTVTAGPDAPAGRPLVLVVRGPSPGLDAARADRPDAVTVHVGLPHPWVPPAPSVAVCGDGRAHAEVAAELLLGSR